VAVVRLRAHGVLVSLVTLHLARGIALLASDGAAVGAADPFFDLIASATLMRVSSPVYVLAACVVAAGLAAGLGCLGTPQSVTVRGRIAVYAVVGAAAGLAGVVVTARDGVAQPMAASGLSFDVLCACALGGASLRGGRGTVVGMLLGVAMVAVALNVMALTHAPAGAHYMMQGAVLAAALLGPERLPRP
jgi:L-arabinose transport system permease protein